MSPTAPPIELTIVYEPAQNDWVQARIAELPAIITAAPSRREAREIVLDALGAYLLSLTADPTHAAAEREPVELTITARGPCMAACGSTAPATARLSPRSRPSTSA